MVVDKINKINYLNDISVLHYGEQKDLIDNYVKSLLYGDLRCYLEEKGVKLFKGISREFTRKYIVRFNAILKLNYNTIGPLDHGFIVDYNDFSAIEYIGFFVFQNNNGNVFGSFPAAYEFANKTYLSNNMIIGNATKLLATNTNVSFGRVIVQNSKMVEKDVEEVVNNDFYLSLFNS
jgi:hypothetical protein